jgi:hypothetical protein
MYGGTSGRSRPSTDGITVKTTTPSKPEPVLSSRGYELPLMDDKF